MKIITIPHKSLRSIAKPILSVDKKLNQFVVDLGSTLQSARNPRGVGLAAPQVDKGWRMFVMNLDRTLSVYINPRIEKHSDQKSFGLDPEDPDLEGCLSMPNFYGAIPRWEWVTLEYDTIVGDTLQNTSHTFNNFAARVVQHEVDHLDGILFTDHSLTYDLPVYRQSPTDPDKYLTIDRAILETI
ncbi:MAG: peptide deformylase [Microgenomates group bacterium]